MLRLWDTPLNNFVGANFHCFEQQPYHHILYQVASSYITFKLLCKEPTDAVDRPLIKSPQGIVMRVITVSIKLAIKNSEQPFYGFA